MTGSGSVLYGVFFDNSKFKVCFWTMLKFTLSLIPL
jgi:hypothetical protein